MLWKRCTAKAKTIYSHLNGTTFGFAGEKDMTQRKWQRYYTQETDDEITEN